MKLTPASFALVDGDPRDDGRRERFLLEEGLDLLAAYRDIDDDGLRARLMAMVRSLADGGAVPACLEP